MFGKTKAPITEADAQYDAQLVAKIDEEMANFDAIADDIVKMANAEVPATPITEQTAGAINNLVSAMQERRQAIESKITLLHEHSMHLDRTIKALLGANDELLAEKGKAPAKPKAKAGEQDAA